MNKFGVLKTKILQKLSDAYASGNKSEMKEILTEVTKNKDFKELYLFYEDVENKYIEDKESAKLYVEEITPLLKEKIKNTSKFCKSLDKKLGDVVILENELYSSLDKLTEHDILKNVDVKLQAKIKLVDHLTKKKQLKEEIIKEFTSNENLLHTVLTHNFNILYNSTLNEDQKEELKKILDITDEDLQNNFKSLKEEVSEKMNKMTVDEKNDDVKKKLNDVLTEVSSMDVSKFNYYKLLQLKNGL
jgi:succinate dehydrogenase flavin-adding protein (antitoxin of CptAB toxin-antitoxin module)